MDMMTKPTCQVVGAGARFTGKQALSYTPGISAETAGAQGIHLQIVTIPPGGPRPIATRPMKPRSTC